MLTKRTLRNMDPVYIRDFILTVLLEFIFVSAIYGSPTTTAEPPGFVYINTTKANLQNENGVMPETLNITVEKTQQGVSEELELHRSDVDVNAPLFVICEDGMSICRQNLDNIKDFALYQDSKRNAAISITKEPGANGEKTVKLEGSILINDVQYAIENHDPASNASTLPYRLEKVRIEDTGVSDYKVLDQPIEYTQLNGRYRRQSSGNYGVELLTVIDHRIYEKWYKTSTVADPLLRDVDTKNKIRKYFAHVVNGMDLRYRAMQANDFQIYIKLAGYVIADRDTSSPWTTTPGVGLEVDADKALDRFFIWRRGTRGLPEHDHATLFTGQDLYTLNDKQEKLLSVTGYAYLGRVCKELSVSIVEDKGGFGCVKTATHELGHSLGANHDGDRNSCATEDQYIMAGSSVPTNELNKLNPWQFSECSVRSFRSKMQSLNSFGPNCLNNEAVTGNGREWDAHLSRHPGQLFSVDDVCVQVLGPSSYMCRDLLPSESDVCTSLWCHINGTNQCRQYVPPRGTTCGNQKWCIDGVCKVDARAPIVRGGCPFGDQPGTAYQDETCAQIVATKPRYCYETFIQQRCCKSCSTVYTSIRGCEYGNRQSRCESWWCTLTNNDTPTVRKQCCGTCQIGRPAPTSPPMTLLPPIPTKDIGEQPKDGFEPSAGCLNRQESCDNDIVSLGTNMCYSREFYPQCCISCEKIRRDIPGCEYGNKDPSMCSSINIDNAEDLCSNSQISTVCCRDCDSFQRKETQTSANGTTKLHLSNTIVFLLALLSVAFYSR